MGAVKVDPTRSDRELQSYDYSYFTEYDLRKLLYKIDYIYAKALDGVHEAICLKVDLENLLTTPILKEYYLISIGERKTDKEDIYEAIAEILKIPHKETVASLMAEEIEIVTNQRKEKHIQWFKNNWEYYMEEPKIHNQFISAISEEDYWEIDKLMKYSKTGFLEDLEEEDFPQDLKDAIAFRRELEERIPKTKEGKRKRQLVSMLIQQGKTIGAMKRSYKIKPLKSTHTHNSFKDKVTYYEDTVEDKGSVMKDYLDKCMIDYAKEDLQGKLTEKQEKIFYLLFEMGLSQRETAQIMGVSQPTISEHLTSIVKKLGDK